MQSCMNQRVDEQDVLRLRDALDKDQARKQRHQRGSKRDSMSNQERDRDRSFVLNIIVSLVHYHLYDYIICEYIYTVHLL